VRKYFVFSLSLTLISVSPLLKACRILNRFLEFDKRIDKEFDKIVIKFRDQLNISSVVNSVFS